MDIKIKTAEGMWVGVHEEGTLKEEWFPEDSDAFHSYISQWPGSYQPLMSESAFNVLKKGAKNAHEGSLLKKMMNVLEKQTLVHFPFVLLEHPTTQQQKEHDEKRELYLKQLEKEHGKTLEGDRQQIKKNVHNFPLDYKMEHYDRSHPLVSTERWMVLPSPTLLFVDSFGEAVSIENAQGYIDRAQECVFIIENMPAAMKEAKRLGVNLAGDQKVKRCRVSKELRSMANATAEVIDLAERLEETQSYVLYVKNKTAQGFLTHNGDVNEDLSCAKVFVQEKKALKEGQRLAKYFCESAVVKIKIEPVSWTPVQNGSSFDVLHEFMTRVDQKKLQDVLEATNIELLRAELKRREAQDEVINKQAPQKRQRL